MNKYKPFQIYLSLGLLLIGFVFLQVIMNQVYPLPYVNKPLIPKIASFLPIIPSKNMPAIINQPTKIANFKKYQLLIMELGNDNHIWYRLESKNSHLNDWLKWKIIDSITPSHINFFTVGSDKSGNISVFATTEDGLLWEMHTKNAVNWSQWYQLGKPANTSVSNPLFALNENSRIQIITTGNDGNAWSVWVTESGSWSGWSNYPHPNNSFFNNILTVGSNQDGRLELFAASSDGLMYHSWQESINGKWSKWNQFPPDQYGGDFVFANGIVCNNQDEGLQLFTLDSIGNLLTIWQISPTKGWSNWAKLSSVSGNGLDAGIGVNRSANGLINIIIPSLNGFVSHSEQRAFNSDWNNWEIFSTLPSHVTFSTTYSRPIIVSENNGDERLFLLGSDGNIWEKHFSFDKKIWSDWNNFGTIPNGFNHS